MLPPITQLFNTDPLTRYQIVAGCGALTLTLAGLARMAVGEGSEAAPVTRVLAVLGTGSYALFAHRLSICRAYPHASVNIGVLPLLLHLLYMTYESNLSPSLGIAFLVCLTIIAFFIESRLWIGVQITTWVATMLCFTIAIESPVLSPVTYGVLVSVAGFFLYLAASSFYDARQRLIVQEAQLQASQALAGLGDWHLDLLSGTTTWSDSAYTILDIDKERQPDFELTDYLVEPVATSELALAMKNLVREGATFNVLSAMRTAKGANIWVRCRGMLVQEGYRATHAMGVFLDVTERVENEQKLTQAKEEAEDAARARTQFLAHMSHEIRTPMNGVIGMASLLEQSELPEVERGYLNVIRSSGESLLQIIDEILQFSKLDAGEVELEPLRFCLETLVCNSLDVVAKVAADKGLVLRLRLPRLNGKQFIGDENKLRQVLVNLLSNAVKFTDQGEVAVYVDVLAADDKSDSTKSQVSIVVQDSGIGIPSRVLPHLFSAFTQADASTTRRFGGTGLGLTISREIVEAMDGQVSVASQPGVGSTFTVDVQLPTVRVDPKTIPDVAINVVSDDAVFTSHVRNSLYPLDMQSTSSTSAAQPGSIVIVDLQTIAWPSIQSLLAQSEVTAICLVDQFLARHDLRTYSTNQRIQSLSHPLRPADLLGWVQSLDDGSDQKTLAEDETVATQQPTPADRHLSILVAEDNPVNQKVALNMLRKLGYRAELATNGREAVQALAKQQFDLIFMDLQMPEVDGVEATRLIRQSEEFRQPHIVALTANALEEDRRRCLEAGMDSFLPKPIRLEALSETLSRLENR